MQRENEVQHVFLVGAKSLGAYGGYETFVYKLTEYHQNKKNIKYHVACKANADNIKIGANAVVTKSFDEKGITLVGIPAHKLER